nr:MAG TPA: hypothetical protein [Caudoviricetes sp.]
MTWHHPKSRGVFTYLDSACLANRAFQKVIPYIIVENSLRIDCDC